MPHPDPYDGWRSAMTAGGAVVVIVGIAAVIAVIAWFLLRRNEPEDAASHAGPERTGSARTQGDVHDRPAGPGAEADGVAGPGEPVPGPSADALPPKGASQA